MSISRNSMNLVLEGNVVTSPTQPYVNAALIRSSLEPIMVNFPQFYFIINQLKQLEFHSTRNIDQKVLENAFQMVLEAFRNSAISSTFSQISSLQPYQIPTTSRPQLVITCADQDVPGRTALTSERMLFSAMPSNNLTLTQSVGLPFNNDYFSQQPRQIGFAAPMQGNVNNNNALNDNSFVISRPQAFHRVLHIHLEEENKNDFLILCEENITPDALHRLLNKAIRTIEQSEKQYFPFSVELRQKKYLYFGANQSWNGQSVSACFAKIVLIFENAEKEFIRTHELTRARKALSSVNKPQQASSGKALAKYQVTRPYGRGSKVIHLTLYLENKGSEVNYRIQCDEKLAAGTLTNLLRSTLKDLNKKYQSQFPYNINFNKEGFIYFVADIKLLSLCNLTPEFAFKELIIQLQKNSNDNEVPPKEIQLPDESAHEVTTNICIVDEDEESDIQKKSNELVNELQFLPERVQPSDDLISDSFEGKTYVEDMSSFTDHAFLCLDSPIAMETFPEFSPDRLNTQTRELDLLNTSESTKRRAGEDGAISSLPSSKRQKSSTSVTDQHANDDQAGLHFVVNRPSKRVKKLHISLVQQSEKDFLLTYSEKLSPEKVRRDLIKAIAEIEKKEQNIFPFTVTVKAERFVHLIAKKNWDIENAEMCFSKIIASLQEIENKTVGEQENEPSEKTLRMRQTANIEQASTAPITLVTYQINRPKSRDYPNINFTLLLENDCYRICWNESASIGLVRSILVSATKLLQQSVGFPYKIYTYDRKELFFVKSTSATGTNQTPEEAFKDLMIQVQNEYNKNQDGVLEEIPFTDNQPNQECASPRSLDESQVVSIQGNEFGEGFGLTLFGSRATNSTTSTMDSQEKESQHETYSAELNAYAEILLNPDLNSKLSDLLDDDDLFKPPTV